MKTLHKVLLSGAVSLPVLGLAGSAFAASNTDTQNFADNFATKLAEKFNLNKDEVSTFLKEDRAAMEAERETKVADALKTAGFTDAQITALKDKKAEQRTEMETWRSENPDATREQMQTQRESEKTEFEAWAKDQGIDLEKVRTALKDAMPMGGHGRGRGGMMGGMMDGDTPPADAPAN